MYINKGKREPLVTRLDNTAEKNPLLWLPCVTLLGAISGTRRLVNDVRTVLSPVKDAKPAVNCYAVISDKPKYVRALSVFLAASMMITFTPGLSGISVTNAFAEETASEAENQDAGQEDGNQEAEGQEDGTQKAEQESSSNTTASKSKKSKKDISITLNCLLKGMAGGNAHVTINKSFLDNSADVWLLSSDAARKDAEDVMMQLGANAAYYVCYPFEINIYDADSNELITSLEDGIASFEMPVPKIMSTCADKIKVYHVVDGHPNFVESEISTGEDGTQSVKFSASEFSTYIFVAPAPAKDNSASKDTVPVSLDDKAPAAGEDTSSADAGGNNNAPAASDDTSSAEADKDNGAGEDTYTADNDDSKNYDLTGEDVSSAAGAHEGSVPVETAAMPAMGGTAPALEAPERIRLSNKKRRYRIVRKRRLDDLVFVF